MEIKFSEKFRNIHRKTSVLESLFNKVTGLQACNFTKKRLQHRRFPENIANYFEKHLRTAASDSSYRLHKNWIKLFRNQNGLLFLLKHKMTLFYLLSFVFIRFNTRCHLPSLIAIFCYSLSFVVTRRHSLSFFVTYCTTRCHSLYHSLSLVVICCTTRCHSLLLVVILCTTRCHSLSLVVIRCHSMYHSSVFL